MNGRALRVLAVSGLLLLAPLAQVRGQACEHPRPSLGIGVFDCQSTSCRILTVRGTDADPRVWEVMEFAVEPLLLSIDPNGPAAGHIRDGDALVAVGGEPITSPRGAANLGLIAGGRPVELTVRRAGRLVTTNLVPTLSCVRLVREEGRIVWRNEGGAPALPAGEGAAPRIARDGP